MGKTKNKKLPVGKTKNSVKKKHRVVKSKRSLIRRASQGMPLIWTTLGLSALWIGRPAGGATTPTPTPPAPTPPAPTPPQPTTGVPAPGIYAMPGTGQKTLINMPGVGNQVYVGDTFKEFYYMPQNTGGNFQLWGVGNTTNYFVRGLVRTKASSIGERGVVVTWLEYVVNTQTGLPVYQV